MPEATLKIRAKFAVSAVTSYNDTHAKTVRLMPLYDPSLPEDQRFSEATPSGSIEMFVNNPSALDALVPGRKFYVDFIPVDEQTNKQSGG